QVGQFSVPATQLQRLDTCPLLCDFRLKSYYLVRDARYLVVNIWADPAPCFSGGSATGLSVTDAWAEQLPVIKVNVWAFLYVPWARNPMCGPGHRGLGALKDGPGPGRPVLGQSLPPCPF